MQRTLATASRQAEVNSRVANARAHLEEGKRFYQLGNLDAARHEFDAALDVLLSAPDTLPDRPRLESELDQIADTIYHYDLEGLGAAASEQPEVVYDKSPLDSILDMTFPYRPQPAPQGQGRDRSHRLPAPASGKRRGSELCSLLLHRTRP